MIKVGNVELGGVPRIAVAVSDKEGNEDLRDRGIDVLELRADRFERLDTDYVTEQIARRRGLGIPLLLTVRNDPAEGGGRPISEHDKMSVFLAGVSGVDAVDIELSSPIVSKVIAVAREMGKPVIVSAHKLDGTPPRDELDRIFSEAKDKGADIVKIAARANTSQDVDVMLKFTRDHKDDQVITMSLGALGSVSRVSFPFAGSLLTYSFVDQPFAEGQIGLKELREALRKSSAE